MDWITTQSLIDNCRLCETDQVPNLQVPLQRKRHPPYSPPQPTEILFVSVAPPWGGDYFWDESRRDRVREGIFKALLQATTIEITSVMKFRASGYFLVPSVKCPSQNGNRDCLPHRRAIANCTRHLESEIHNAQPRRILALGLSAMKGVGTTLGLKIPPTVEQIVGELWWAKIDKCLVPVAGTYFPGNNRHQGFNRIHESIRSLLGHEAKRYD